VVLPALLKTMNDPSGGVRFRVSDWLGRIRPAQVVLPTLIERLKQGEPNTRTAAAGALWYLCDARDRDPQVARRAVEALAAALADRDPEVRSGAAWSLMRFGADARTAEPALRSATNDPDRRVRDNASATLRAIADGQGGR
jgi:HEAT repeat protein